MPDFSESKCCQAQYDSDGNLNFYGDSRSDTVCTLGAGAGLCSLKKVSNSITLQNYFQMYQQCIEINERFNGDINIGYTQFKGQGLPGRICGEFPAMTLNSQKQQYRPFEFKIEDTTQLNAMEADATEVIGTEAEATEVISTDSGSEVQETST